MFKNDEQRAVVCLALLDRIGLQRLWTLRGPTEEAQRLLAEDGGALSSGERAMLLVAWALWNGSGKLTLSELIQAMDGEHLAAVGTLLSSLRFGADGVDDWLLVEREAADDVDLDVGIDEDVAKAELTKH